MNRVGDREATLPPALRTGERDERLDSRKVVHLLWRCVRLLRPVVVHVGALCAGFAGLALILLPAAFLLLDVFWTRILQGNPATPLEATLLRMDPTLAVHVDALSEATRRMLARRTVALGIAIAAVSAPLFLGLWYYQIWILQRVNQLLRVRLLDRLQALSLRFHFESRVGDAIYRLTQDSAMVTELIDVLFLTPLYATARFAVSLAVVCVFDPLLAAIMAAILVPALLLGNWFSGRLRRGFRAAREANASLTARIQESVAGMRVIKAYGAERLEQERFEGASRRAFDAAFRARHGFAVYGIAIFWTVGLALVAAGGLAALYTQAELNLFAQRLVIAFGVTAWNLGLFNFFKARFGDGANQVRRLFRTWGRVQDVAIGLDRVFELLDLEPEVRDVPGAIDFAGVDDRVSFRDVWFRYRPDRPTLQGIHLDAKVGTVTAVVGHTGAGKSTLMALLLRLFEPERGTIELDGLNLRRFKVQTLRARIAIALQENLLFGTTVRENIRFAVPGATNERVQEAARIACANEFIEQLPLGYDTPLGERGTKLSTGQRQRLSIARAVLKDAPILILDEPTASLDAETELRVLRNLATWGRERVVFLITHRLSTIRHADQIVVLDEGRIVERGRHAELAAREKSAYRKLLELHGARAPATATAGGPG